MPKPDQGLEYQRSARVDKTVMAFKLKFNSILGVRQLAAAFQGYAALCCTAVLPACSASGD